MNFQPGHHQSSGEPTPQDNPSASPDGFGNYAFAIDLGQPGSSNNDRYPSATVWVGSCYAGNVTGKQSN